MLLCAAKLRVPLPRNVVRTYMSTLTQTAPHDDECLFMLILGKPGGGKGTISGKILKVSRSSDDCCSTSNNSVEAFLTCAPPLSCQDFPQLHHLSTGDLLRQNVRMQTALGKKAKSYMDDGQLVPDELMIDLVMSDATPHLEDGKSLLLDGFPRTLPQAQALDQVVNVDVVINLDIPTEVIVERIADRYVHGFDLSTKPGNEI